MYDLVAIYFTGNRQSFCGCSFLQRQQIIRLPRMSPYYHRKYEKQEYSFLSHCQLVQRFIHCSLHSDEKHGKQASAGNTIQCIAFSAGKKSLQTRIIMVNEETAW